MIEILKHDQMVVDFQKIDDINKLKLPAVNNQTKFITMSKINMIDFIDFVLSKINAKSLYLSNSSIDSKGVKGLDKISKSVKITAQINSGEEKRKPELLEKFKNLNCRTQLFRTHTKIILVSDGVNYYSLEGSGNISTNAEIEQYTLSNNKEIYDFHKSWIEKCFSGEIDIKEEEKKQEKNQIEPDKKIKSSLIEEQISIAESDEDFLYQFLERRPTKTRNITIPEFLPSVTIPAGKLKGSKYSLERTPYLERPLWYMSPQCNIMETYLMWSAQTSKTTTADICSAYYTSILPSEIMFCAKESGAARKWANKRYVPICGKLGVEFRTSSEDKKSRSSGNTVYAKEFDGGNIDIASSLSSSQIASETKRVALADEISRWKEDLNGEGSPLELLKARLKQWGEQAKFLGISTPHLEDDIMHREYKRGTQEHFHIKCPLGCGADFPLEWMDGGTSGFTWDTEAGRVSQAYYVCPKCGNVFFEKKKPTFNASGIWVAHATPDDPFVASMNLNALYSPFESWMKIAKEGAKAKEDPMAAIAYTNIYKGLPHKETGTRPEAEKVKESNSVDIFQQGDIPNDCLYLSFGSDVQDGKKIYEDFTDEQIEKELESFRNTGKDPWNQGLPRIELTLISNSWAWRTHVVSHKVFYGKTTDPYGGAFQKLREWILETELTFRRKDGTTAVCPVGFIDSSQGSRTDIVYNFCESFPDGMIFPCKGNNDLLQNKDKVGDKITSSSSLRFRESKTGYSKPLIVVSTNYYKSQIYNRLRLGRVNKEEQSPGFISFPVNMPDLYYKMLTAEEKRRDGSFYQGGRRNESLDTMVYGNSAAEYYLQDYVKKARELIRKKGMTRAQVEKTITTRSIIEKMKMELLQVQKRFGK